MRILARRARHRRHRPTLVQDQRIQPLNRPNRSLVLNLLLQRPNLLIHCHHPTEPLHRDYEVGGYQ